MILMGALMFTGKMNDITGYLSASQTQEETGQNVSGTDGEAENETDGSSDTGEEESPENGGGDSGTVQDENGTGSDAGKDAGGSRDTDEGNLTPAYNFELKDQYGNTHRLEDYRGKVVFLNFWGTWCPPCRAEMPDIQKLYEEYSAQGDAAEVVILGAAAPEMGQEGDASSITQFMEENGYTYPVLMDESWEMFNWYGITSFPTTFMIDRNGNVYGYVTGQMSEDIMRSIIRQTLGEE